MSVYVDPNTDRGCLYHSRFYFKSTMVSADQVVDPDPEVFSHSTSGSTTWSALLHPIAEIKSKGV